jgi:hypothetical protein
LCIVAKGYGVKISFSVPATHANDTYHTKVLVDYCVEGMNVGLI